MIVVDSSAWIEHFRETGSPAELAVRRLLGERAEIAVTEVVTMDLLAGAVRPGETIRKLSDCLVAVPTLRAGATLLHADRDFDVLARHTPLRIEPLLG